MYAVKYTWVGRWEGHGGEREENNVLKEMIWDK